MTERRRLVVLVTVFAVALFTRTWGITHHFWLDGDAIRDWRIVLDPPYRLPLVGPLAHSGEHSLGPAFYWVLWLIRVTVGWPVENLPHAGGIGQALMQSAADSLLLAAIWQRTRSVWLALTTTLLIATTPYLFSLSSSISSPMMASTLTTIATACVLLRWSERAVGGAAGATFAAWCAVQCFSGAIFAALGVFAALLCAPLLQGNRAMFRRTAWTVAVVVALLQIPHALNAANRATDSVDRADPARLGRMLPIKTEPRLVRGWAGFARAVNSIEASPWNAPWVAWFFVPCAAVVAVKHRQDVSLLSLTLLPPIAAIAGHALFVPNSPDYYDYLSLMPAVVLTFLLALTAVSSPLAARNVAVTAFALSLVLVPFRLRFSQTIRRMPEYGVLLDGSRKIARRGQPVRGIRTEFVLPVTSDSEFLYTLLGGRIDPSSPWVALIKADGEVVYQRIGGV